MKCPKCKNDLPDSVILSGYAAIGGRSKSEKKKEAARLNGAKGGRPRNIITNNEVEK